jgi:hypothetical protein
MGLESRLGAKGIYLVYRSDFFRGSLMLKRMDGQKDISKNRLNLQFGLSTDLELFDH